MQRLPFFSSFLLGVALCSAGCDPSSPISGPRPCTTQSECRAGQVCIDGHCAAPMDSGPVVQPDAASPFSDSGPPNDADTAPRCGDGHLRVGEQCDDGNLDPSDGCDASCMLEPNYVCPTPGSPCTSTIVCGDGVLGGSEACDDHNLTPGDGCGASCALEAGWTCMSAGLPCTAAACGDGIIAGTEDCEDGGAPPASGDGCDASCHFEDGFACGAAGTPCVRVTCGNGVREGTEQCDDGNHDLGDGCDPFCHDEPVCTDGTCMSVCGDGVLLPGEACDDGNVRDGDGCDHSCMPEPGFTCMPSGTVEPGSVAIPVVYRDFRGADLSGGHIDFENALGDDRGIVATMLDTAHKPAYANVGGTTSTTHGEGFFRQWYRDTAGTNLTVVDRLTLARTGPGTYVFDDGNFFPLDGLGWVAMGTEPARTGGHNFSFTSELRYWFVYAGGETLTFRGDDDVWVFINDRLALDIGGVHGAETASITLDGATASTLGMRTGGIYEACVFQAERHTTQSSYQLTLVGFNTTHSECTWTCGDGIVTRFEICDDGVNDGTYGHCLPGCLGFGPRCGDAVLDTAHGEACDDGTNAGGYGQCAPGCVLGPRCGDHAVQSANGEQCDDGNTLVGDGCDASCQNEVH